MGILVVYPPCRMRTVGLLVGGTPEEGVDHRSSVARRSAKDKCDHSPFFVAGLVILAVVAIYQEGLG
ncbi:MAG: hypothetical protein EA401_07525 [Planctomycetota bacterium]|nr:MAG: hypothetical protein EA401_07525 [Planctomycetota bacterium]